MARRLGSYELQELLGQGGMGQVWLAHHTMLRRPAAIKVITPEAVADARSAELVLKRFEREARMTSMLSCPHTIQVHDFGLTEDGKFYYAMEHLRGITLNRLVEEFGPQSAARTVWIGRQICESLSEAHKVGLVHRDIKPGNVFLCKLGVRYDFVKVLDFGLVKLTDNSSPDLGQLTEANVAAGSPAFIPPEVVHGSARFDARADIYSLGCVLYWLLTGQLVFEGVSALALVMAHVQDTPVRPSQRTEVPIPRELDDIVMRCLAKQPEQRPQSAQELSRLLAACKLDDTWDNEQAEEWWRDHYPDIALNVSQPIAIHDVEPDRQPSPEPKIIQPLVTDRPSLVVLPFENLGGDANQEYLSLGISEDILIELSKFKALFVISRRSAFAHKGTAGDIQKIAAEFGVQYVVRGSVRRGGDRIRISVQLIDTNGGEQQLWGDRYDRPVDEIFDVQDEVVRMIVATVAGRVEAARLEHAKRKKPAMLDAYDCVLRGKELHHLHTPEASIRALELFQRAIDLDPDYALAYCWFLCTSGSTPQFDPNNPDSEFMRRIQGYMGKAYELDADEAECHRLLAEIAMWQGDFVKGQYHQQRAIELNPNDERTVCLSGEVAMAHGQGEVAVEWIRKAMRLNPYHPARWWGHLGRAHHMAGQYGEALLAFRRLPAPALRERAFMVACCVELDDAEGVREHCAAVLALDPHFSSGSFVASLQYKHRSLLDPLVRALRAAGLPT